jgi:hypothetical protein
MIIRKTGVRALLIYAPAVAALIAVGHAQTPRTLQDWGSTPMSATLCPDPADDSGKLLLLEVENSSTSPIRVTRIELLQVGRASDNWTIASQPLSDALHGDWKLAPGEKKQWKFDLRKTTFKSDEGLLSGPADEFARQIPEADRYFMIEVLHKSSMWPGGYDQMVYYRPGKSGCPEPTSGKEGGKSPD